MAAFLLSACHKNVKSESEAKQQPQAAATEADQNVSENESSGDIAPTEEIQPVPVEDESVPALDEAGVRAAAETMPELKTINFSYDKYTLTEEAKETLGKNAELIKSENMTVTVEGNCDSRGTVEYNLSLGQKRANVVKEYYVLLGVPEKSIATISYGEEKPLCEEENENCWQKNRRAETKLQK